MLQRANIAQEATTLCRKFRFRETELESEMLQEAATFYKKFGFQETEVVKDYYKLADGRDALILSRDLTGEPELAAAQPT